MTRQYRLKQPLPGYKAGSIFEQDDELKTGWQLVAHSSGADKDGYKWATGYAESIGHSLAQYLDAWCDDADFFEPVLPTPLAKATYAIRMYDAQPGEGPLLLNEKLDLTPDQAEALAKAIEALLQYCNDTPKNPAMPFYPKYLVDACEAAREAIQDGSAA